MERLLKPKVFDTDHTDPNAAKNWKYFYKTFQNFVTAVEAEEGAADNKLQLLINHVSPDVFTYIEDCNTYDTAIDILKNLLLCA